MSRIQQHAVRKASVTLLRSLIVFHTLSLLSSFRALCAGDERVVNFKCFNSQVERRNRPPLLGRKHGDVIICPRSIQSQFSSVCKHRLL